MKQWFSRYSDLLKESKNLTGMQNVCKPKEEEGPFFFQDHVFLHASLRNTQLFGYDAIFLMSIQLPGTACGPRPNFAAYTGVYRILSKFLL